jgi:hypothetical protein
MSGAAKRKQPRLQGKSKDKDSKSTGWAGNQSPMIEISRGMAARRWVFDEVYVVGDPSDVAGPLPI